MHWLSEQTDCCSDRGQERLGNAPVVYLYPVCPVSCFPPRRFAHLLAAFVAVLSAAELKCSSTQLSQQWGFGYLYTLLKKGGDGGSLCACCTFLSGRFPEWLHGTEGHVQEGGCTASSAEKRIFVTMCKERLSACAGQPQMPGLSWAGTMVLHALAAISELSQREGHPCSSQGYGLTHCTKSISSISWHFQIWDRSVIFHDSNHGNALCVIGTHVSHSVWLKWWCPCLGSRHCIH